MPIQELKIDSSFVKTMLSNDRDHAIVDSTVHLAHRLDLTAVAEGVEDAETLTALGDLGCQQAQGYHIGKPMPAKACEAWLTERLNPER